LEDISKLEGDNIGMEEDNTTADGADSEESASVVSSSFTD
jgi:hypothetical protein